MMYILDSIDLRIISLLKKDPLHVSALALISSIPRTTITYRLSRLEGCHRVCSVIDGKKRLWSLSKNLEHSKEHFKHFSGESFYECYKIMYSLKRDSIIYAVQGIAAVKAEFETIPHTLITDIHELYKRRKILMLGVTNKDIMSIVDQLSNHLQKSHVGRPQGILITDHLFKGAGELFVTKRFVLIVDPKKCRAILIKEPNIVELFFDLMRLFYTLTDELKRVDLNSHLAVVASK